MKLFMAAVLMAGCVGLQLAREQWYGVTRPEDTVLYIRSGPVLTKLTLSFTSLFADLYWMRTLQHYGSTRLSTDPNKRYDRLYPLLDLTTTLDRRFSIAYRFGAIFLAEPFPDGPGRPDQAVTLLKKGVAADPKKWEYLMDIGFVYYWWPHDYREAARWFQRASDVAGAPWWLKSVAGTTLVQGGDRTSSRYLWQRIRESAQNDFMRRQAERSLTQLDALDEIDQLMGRVDRFVQVTGRFPDSWAALGRAGLLAGVLVDRTGTPLDPAGVPYVLDSEHRVITVSNKSLLFPLPTMPQRR